MEQLSKQLEQTKLYKNYCYKRLLHEVIVMDISIISKNLLHKDFIKIILYLLQCPLVIMLFFSNYIYFIERVYSSIPHIDSYANKVMICLCVLSLYWLKKIIKIIFLIIILCCPLMILNKYYLFGHYCFIFILGIYLLICIEYIASWHNDSKKSRINGTIILIATIVFFIALLYFIDLLIKNEFNFKLVISSVLYDNKIGCSLIAAIYLNIITRMANKNNEN